MLLPNNHGDVIIMVMLFLSNIDLMKYSFLIFNSTSFFSCVEYFLIFIDLFLKMSFNLIMTSRIVAPGVPVTVCSSIILLLLKKKTLKEVD